MIKNADKTQIIWGVALVVMGTALFFRIPRVMPQIKQIEQFSSVTYFIQFCMYLMGVLLISGGARKIYMCLMKEPGPTNDRPVHKETGHKETGHKKTGRKETTSHGPDQENENNTMPDHSGPIIRNDK